jgi:hypothetical protein
MAQRAQLDGVRQRLQQPLRQQFLHPRHHPGDVAVAATEVAVAIEIGQEEFRRRPTSRIGHEALETRRQPRRLPSAQFREPAQAVAGLAHRIVHGMVPGQATGERNGQRPLVEAATAMGQVGRDDLHRQSSSGRPVAGTRPPRRTG